MEETYGFNTLTNYNTRHACMRTYGRSNPYVCRSKALGLKDCKRVFPDDRFNLRSRSSATEAHAPSEAPSKVD